MINTKNNELLHTLGSAAALALGTGLVLWAPRSIWALLVFIGSILWILGGPLLKPARWALAVLALGLLLPWIGQHNESYLDVAVTIGIYMALAIGLNVVVGFAGLLDLGYVAFYGIGAYLYAIFASPHAKQLFENTALAGLVPLSGNWFWPFLLFGVIAAAISGVLLGLPVLRLRGDYLAIVTLGFGEIIRILLNNLNKPINITNGPKGIVPVAAPEIGSYSMGSLTHYYFIALALVLLTVVVARRMEHSWVGRAWAAIREDEIAARAMGIPLVKIKLLAFAAGASFAGAMGALFAAKLAFVDPTSFSFMESIGILAMVILGGMGSINGALIGATAVVVLQFQILKSLSEWMVSLSTKGLLNLPSQLDPSKLERFIFGIILVLMMLFRPEGILPERRRELDLPEPNRIGGGN